MATQTPSTLSVIPSLPRDTKLVEPSTGKMDSNWYTFFQQLILALQTSITSEGFVVPKLVDTDVSQLGSNTNSVGTIVYDSVNNEYKAIILIDVGPPVVTQTKTFTLA